MYRVCGIIGMCMLALLAGVSRTVADDYVEDVYFWADAAIGNAEEGVVPNYNKHAKEIIFIDDSVTAQHPDTVRAIIRDKQR